ncbi:MAG TPA: CTQ-dependent lysine 6-oxidase LodA [Mucilaginibacter sp.]
MKLNIHPSVGIARLGNSKLPQFYLSPDSIGGLPFDADHHGNKLGPVKNFKDEAGAVKRQGQVFSIYDENNVEITPGTSGVKSIQWYVHLANKKAAWYDFSELDGNLLFPDNSYQDKKTPFRNSDEPNRQSLVVDPGWRTISGLNQTVGFDAQNVPPGYPSQFPPSTVIYGLPVTTLGDLKTDSTGRLIVLGGYGNAGGDLPLSSYGGANTWHDDISDGPVYATVNFQDGSSVNLQAWVVVGSPDFAPEIVNISALSDTMFDVGVHYFNLVPDMYNGGNYKPSFVANYQRDILPIINRMANYQWVSNVQPMMALTANRFDFTDPSHANMQNRQTYFSYFREPNKTNDASPYQPSQDLFENADALNFPMLPVNSGSNSVSNDDIVKFLALNETQYFLLGQWANGSFVSDPNYASYPGVNDMDTVGVGNCVGLPMCPGIEVTWNMQNPAVYSAPFVIANTTAYNGYDSTGLDPNRDECLGGGCQPGDLTKRMACPWQADFFQCTFQNVNFTDPTSNNSGDSTGPTPPTYYAYWWPPQAPWDVIAGETTKDGQAAANVVLGQQFNYSRGINQFAQMVEHWFSLAFIRNRNAGAAGFPFFTETERNNLLFTYEALPVSTISGNSDDNQTEIPVWYIPNDNPGKAPQSLKAKALTSDKAQKMVAFLEERAFKHIETVAGGLGKPRSGSKVRR